MTLVEFLILTLAVFRLARLVIEDTITEPLRDFALSRWPGKDVEYDLDDIVRGGVVSVGFGADAALYAKEPTKTGDKVAKLLSCYWCAVPYIAGVTVVLFWRFPGPTFWLASIAAISGLASIIGILMHEAVE